MDIPTPDTVTIYPRTGEGAYEPAYGAGVSSIACAQNVTTRTVDANGEETMSDMLVIAPPLTAAEPGDMLETGGAWFDVVSVDRLAIGAAAHHVELLCKSRPAQAEAPVTPVEIIGIDWIESDGCARPTFGGAVEFEAGDYPEFEFEYDGGRYPADGNDSAGVFWYPSVGNDSAGVLSLTIFDVDREEIALPAGTPWRVLTQPALISTPLVVPVTGTLGFVPA